VDGATTQATVAGLTNGVAYTFTVTATNAAGIGPASDPSNAVTPETAGPPAAPTGVTAAPGDASAIVGWTAPTDDGGSPITGYTVTSDPDGLIVQVDGSTTQATVNGLTNGLPYTFTVTATNASGTGQASVPSDPVTPVYPPPTLAGFTPGAAPVGNPVTVVGTNLLSAQAVSFAGTSATFQVVSDTEITAVLPDGAVTGPVTVVTGGGSATTPNAFSVMPTITAFTPSSGKRGSTVTISGTGFFAVTRVLLADKPIAFTVGSYWSVWFVVPRKGTSGHITVITAAGKFKSKQSFTITGKIGSPDSAPWFYSSPPMSRL
jgi:hypothetical protein